MRRTSVFIDEFQHRNPIPNACRIGNMLVSSLIRGVDPSTATIAPTLEQQCAFMFLHLQRTVEAGGATLDDVIKVTVWMQEIRREPVNAEWVKLFPDRATRPARQVMLNPIEPGVFVQCEFIAVLGS